MSKSINELIRESIENDGQVLTEGNENGFYDPAILPSISAGVGALETIKHLRDIKEGKADKLKKVGKYAGAGLAAGAVGAAAMANKDKIADAAEKAGKTIKKGVGKLMNKEEDKPATITTV